MSGALAVYRKELATYFRSPIAYYVIAVFLLGTGYFFLYNIFLTGDAAMNEHVAEHGHPAAHADPRHHHAAVRRRVHGGTMELLLTLPLRPWQIVSGKYFGAVTIWLLMSPPR